MSAATAVAPPRLLKDDPVAKLAAWMWLTVPRRLAARLPALRGIVGDGHILTAVPQVAVALTVGCFGAGFWVGAQHWGYTFIATESVFLLSAFLALGVLSAQLGLAALVGYILGDFFVRLTVWNYTVLSLGGSPGEAPSSDDPLAGFVTESDGLLDSGFVAGLWRVRLPLLILYGLYAVGGLVVPRLARGVAAMVLRRARLPGQLNWLVGSLAYVVTIWLGLAGWVASAPLLFRPVFTWKGGTAGSLPPAVATVPLQTFRREIVAAAVLAAIVRQLALFLYERSPRARARVDVVDSLAEPIRPPRPATRAASWGGVLAAAVIAPLMAAGMLERAWTWGLAVLVALLIGLLRSGLLPARVLGAWSGVTDRVPVLARVIGLIVGVRVVAGVLAGSVITSYESLAVFVLTATLVGALLLPPSPDGPGPGGRLPRLPVGALLLLTGLGGLVAVVASAQPALADNCSVVLDCFAVAAAMADAAGAAATIVPVVLAAGATATTELPGPARAPGGPAPAAAQLGAAAASEALVADLLGQAPVAPLGAGAAAPVALAAPAPGPTRALRDVVPAELAADPAFVDVWSPVHPARAAVTVNATVPAGGAVHHSQGGGPHAEELLVRSGNLAAATAAALQSGTPSEPAVVDVVVNRVPCTGCAQMLASQLDDQLATLTPGQQASVRHELVAGGPHAPGDAATTTRSIQVLLEAGWDVRALDVGAGSPDHAEWLAGAVTQVRDHLGLPTTAAPAAAPPAFGHPQPAAAAVAPPAPAFGQAQPGQAAALAPPAPGVGQALPGHVGTVGPPGSAVGQALSGQAGAFAPPAPGVGQALPGQAGTVGPPGTVDGGSGQQPGPSPWVEAPAATIGRAASVAAEADALARQAWELARRSATGPGASAVAARAEEAGWKAVFAASQAHQGVLAAGAPVEALVRELAQTTAAAYQTVESAGSTSDAAAAAMRAAASAQEACRVAQEAVAPGPPPPATAAVVEQAAPPTGGGVGPPVTPPGPPGVGSSGAADAEPPDDLGELLDRTTQDANTARRAVDDALEVVAQQAAWANLGRPQGTAAESEAAGRVAVDAASLGVRAATELVAGISRGGRAAAADPPAQADVSTLVGMTQVVPLAARLADLAVDASAQAAAALGLDPAVPGTEPDGALVDSTLVATVQARADAAQGHWDRRGLLDDQPPGQAEATARALARQGQDAASALMRQAAAATARAATTGRRVEATLAARPVGGDAARAAALVRRADEAAQVVALLAELQLRLQGGPGEARRLAAAAVPAVAAAGRAVLGADEVARVVEETAAAPGPADPTPLRVFATTEESANYGRTTWSAARDELSEEQLRALIGWTTTLGLAGWPGYRAINAVCRSDRGNDFFPATPAHQANAQRSVDLIDEALRLQPAPEDVLVVREVRAEAFDRPISELAGTVQHDPAFLATALTAGPEYKEELPVVVHLRVPAGTPALYLDDVSLAPHEHELLLGRDTRYRVVAPPRRIGGRWQVYATVLPTSPPGQAP